MTTMFYAGAVLLALLVSVLPALAHKPHWQEIRRTLASPLLMLNELLIGESGAVVVTYAYPGSGTVPATAQQASQVQAQTLQISFADADTTGLVTHNFGLQTATFTPNTGQFFPEVLLTPGVVGTAFPALGVVWTSGNVITIAKGNTATGSGGTYVVTIRRPHSMGQ